MTVLCKISASKITGILITNLGTPDAPTVGAVRAYLKEFLSDRFVVDLPSVLWKPLLYSLILPFRPFKTVKLYQKIWKDNSSPLLLGTLSLAKRLKDSLHQQFPERKITIVVGMRYGKPSLGEALEQLQGENIEKLIILPLYPQYSHSTTQSTLAMINQILTAWKSTPTVYHPKHYADHPLYIEALVESIMKHFIEFGEPERLVFSFHGLPERSLKKGDPYYNLCQKSVALTAKRLPFPREKILLTFQSRFGFAKWIGPATIDTLATLAKIGIKKVSVICPGFAVDCLETLEEINIQNRSVFMSKGGEVFHYIPALNDNLLQIRLLQSIITDYFFA